MKAKRLFGMSLALVLGATGAARAGNPIVGAVSPEGGSYLIKQFRVAPGTTVLGVKFTNNDPTTVFPRILFLRGSGTTIASLAIAAEVQNVTAITDHLVSVVFAPVIIDDWEDVSVAVEFPLGDGVNAFGSGAGIISQQLEEPEDCYFTWGTDAPWGPMDVDYQLELVTPALKAAAAVRHPAARVHPNPFNPTVTIEFAVPKRQRVEIVIHDVAGRRVRSLLSRQVAPGVHEEHWDGRDDTGARVATGIYLASVRIGKKAFTHKLVLAK